MNIRIKGISGIQVLVAILALAALSFAAVPKYKSYMAQAKLTEAFTLASASKPKIIEFYTVNNRFPRTADEAYSVRSEAISPPEFAKHIVVDYQDGEHDIVVKVFLQEGVVPNETGEPQYVFIAADRATQGGYQTQWTCGALGIASDLLPKDCRA